MSGPAGDPPAQQDRSRPHAGHGPVAHEGTVADEQAEPPPAHGLCQPQTPGGGRYPRRRRMAVDGRDLRQELDGRGDHESNGQASGTGREEHRGQHARIAHRRRGPAMPAPDPCQDRDEGPVGDDRECRGHGGCPQSVSGEVADPRGVGHHSEARPARRDASGVPGDDEAPELGQEEHGREAGTGHGQQSGERQRSLHRARNRAAGPAVIRHRGERTRFGARPAAPVTSSSAMSAALAQQNGSSSHVVC